MGSGARDSTASGAEHETATMLRLLGPTSLERDGAPIAIGGKGQRAVLLRLALAEGRLVPVDRLVEDLWGDDASASIIGTLQAYVSRLRSALQDPNALRREGPGYVLALERHQVDAHLFEDLAVLGRAVVDEDPELALARLDEALALWRGPAFADVADSDWAIAASTRLDEMRLVTHECRFDALLALGRHVALVADIEEALHEHPLRERFSAS